MGSAAFTGANFPELTQQQAPQPQQLLPTLQPSLPLEAPPTAPSAHAEAQHLPRNLSSAFQRMLDTLPSTAGAILQPTKGSPAPADSTPKLPDLQMLAAPVTAPTTKASRPAAPIDLPDIKTIVSSKQLAVMGTDLADGNTVAQTAKTRMMAMFRSTLFAAFTTAARDRQIHQRQNEVLSAFTDLTRKVLDIDHAVRSYHFYGSTDETKHADSVSIGPIHGNFLFDTIIQIWTVPACAGALGEWNAYYHSKFKPLRESVATAMNSSASRISFAQLVTYMENFSTQLHTAINGFVQEANKFVRGHTSQTHATFSLFEAHDGWLHKLMGVLPQTDSRLGLHTEQISNPDPGHLTPFPGARQTPSASIPSFQAYLSASSPANPWTQTQLPPAPFGISTNPAPATQPAWSQAMISAADATPAESAFSVQHPSAAHRTVSKRANNPQELAAKRQKHRMQVMQAGSAPHE